MGWKGRFIAISPKSWPSSWIPCERNRSQCNPIPQVPICSRHLDTLSANTYRHRTDHIFHSTGPHLSSSTTRSRSPQNQPWRTQRFQIPKRADGKRMDWSCLPNIFANITVFYCDWNTKLIWCEQIQFRMGGSISPNLPEHHQPRCKSRSIYQDSFTELPQYHLGFSGKQSRTIYSFRATSGTSSSKVETTFEKASRWR